MYPVGGLLLTTMAGSARARHASMRGAGEQFEHLQQPFTPAGEVLSPIVDATLSDFSPVPIRNAVVEELGRLAGQPVETTLHNNPPLESLLARASGRRSEIHGIGGDARRSDNSQAKQFRRKRPSGTAKGLFVVPEDFDEPLDDFNEYM